MIKQKHRKNNLPCNIVWHSGQDIARWYEDFVKVVPSNLLQSPDYGISMAQLNRQNLRHGTLYIQGTKAGLVQILEVGICRNAIQAVILDRGPLWLDGFGTEKDFDAFLEAFSCDFPKRIGRRIRLIPEIEHSGAVDKILQNHGYRSAASNQNYETILLDLQHNLEDLRANLRSSWRQELKKAEKRETQIVWSDEGQHFSWLMTHYEQDRKIRQYDGASLKTITALAKQFSRGKNMLIGTALLDNAPIASILLFIHGTTATYQIGYTSDQGRENKAHHLLLWTALAQLKDKDIKILDLGGVNEKRAKGVKIFKQGMGGRIYETPGIYC